MHHTDRRAVRSLLLTAVLLAAAVFSGCGKGGKKEVDILATEVLKLTITPAPTPTPAPEQKYPDATDTREGITMVNLFLADAADGKNPYAGMAEKLRGQSSDTQQDTQEEDYSEEYYEEDSGDYY